MPLLTLSGKVIARIRARYKGILGQKWREDGGQGTASGPRLHSAKSIAACRTSPSSLTVPFTCYFLSAWVYYAVGHKGFLHTILPTVLVGSTEIQFLFPFFCSILQEVISDF